MNVLSLFDGISCGKLALERAGIPVTRYYASEIDKYAVKISQKNYPDIVQLGDIKEFKGNFQYQDEIRDDYINNWPAQIELIIGGSPCQGFSFAGKQLAFDDTRSKLFWKFVEIVNYYKPKYFLLENVRMKKEHQDVISKALGVEPICINSSLVSAQNRVRYYWTNIPNITQPEDKEIMLSDIILDDVEADQSKSYCLDANYYKGGNLKSYFEKHRRQIVFQKGRGNNPGFIKERDKCPTMSSNSWQHNCKLLKVGYANHFNGQENSKRIYSIVGKSSTLLAMSGGNHEPKIAVDETVYRKLTPIECERLQTLPDNYTAGVSNTQRYKMLGNGWTVDVLAHIFKNII